MTKELESLAIAWQELREAIGTMLCSLPDMLILADAGAQAIPF